MKEIDLETERQRRLHETSLFVLKLLFLGILFRLLLASSPDTYFLQELLASQVRTFLGFLGIELQQQGVLLIGEKGSYLINQDCLGWKSMAAFAALVIASAEEVRNLWKYLALGILGLIAVNFLRIVTTVVLSYHGILSFEIIHTFLWKWGLTLIVFGFWVLYLLKAR